MRGIAPSAEQRVLKRWARALDEAGSTDLAALKARSVEAHALRQKIDAFLNAADGALALAEGGAGDVPKPLHCDWAFRPGLWSGPVRPHGIAGVVTGVGLGGDTTLFHDCPQSEITFRQIRNARTVDGAAPFAVRLDVLAFRGSFLSLVVDLPDAACNGLQKRHIIRQTLSVEAEAPLEMFARLNIKHGPNTEQIVQEFEPEDGIIEVEYDLAYTDLDAQRIERMWADVIFEGPKMNQVTVREMTFVRHPRADM